MEKMSCLTCKYFEDSNGFCRRYPATPLVIKKNTKFVVEGMFPIIYKPALDWCGEYKLKDDKQLLNG